MTKKTELTNKMVAEALEWKYFYINGTFGKFKRWEVLDRCFDTLPDFMNDLNAGESYIASHLRKLGYSVQQSSWEDNGVVSYRVDLKPMVSHPHLKYHYAWGGTASKALCNAFTELKEKS